MPIERTKKCEEVQKFILEKVFDPAFESGKLDEKLLAKMQRAKNWISFSKKAGDLAGYVKTAIHSSRSKKGDLLEVLHSHGLLAFEDIEKELHEKFNVSAPQSHLKSIF